MNNEVHEPARTPDSTQTPHQQARPGVDLRVLLVALLVSTATTELLHALFR